MHIIILFGYRGFLNKLINLLQKEKSFKLRLKFFVNTYDYFNDLHQLHTTCCLRILIISNLLLLRKL